MVAPSPLRRPLQHTGAVGGALASRFAPAAVWDFMLFNTDMLRQYELIAQEVRAPSVPGTCRGPWRPLRWQSCASRSSCVFPWPPRRPAAAIAWWRPDGQAGLAAAGHEQVGLPCLQGSRRPWAAHTLWGMNGL
jgi:hypothetical protein